MAFRWRDACGPTLQHGWDCIYQAVIGYSSRMKLYLMKLYFLLSLWIVFVLANDTMMKCYIVCHSTDLGVASAQSIYSLHDGLFCMLNNHVSHARIFLKIICKNNPSGIPPVCQSVCIHIRATFRQSRFQRQTSLQVEYEVYEIWRLPNDSKT